MGNELLRLRDVRVCAGEKEILHGVDLTINRGETHVLLGPNGAGKSTLGYALMGHPAYAVTGGSAWFQGQDLLDMPVHKRAAAGLFLSFQNPVEAPGISLENFIRSALEQRGGKRVRLWDFRKELKKTLELLHMDPAYAERDLNVGFSGGERKKAEILQMLLLKPSLAILDETDSGLDVDAVRTVSRGVQEFQKDGQTALLIITHSAGILSALHVDRAHVLADGRLVETGDAALLEKIQREGFAAYEAPAPAEKEPEA